MSTIVVPPQGIAGATLRTLATQAKADVDAMIPYVTDEWSAPAAASTTSLLAAAPTVASPVQVLAAALDTVGKAALAAGPRQVVFTTGGGTPADAPDTVDIVGTDWDDAALSETLAVPQTAASAASVNYYKTIVSIDYPAAQGTDATVAIGHGAPLGLHRPVKTRAGVCNVIREIAAGALVATGSFTNSVTAPPYGAYTPSSAPDGARNYAVTYEQEV